jgi:hypothetical protein
MRRVVGSLVALPILLVMLTSAVFGARPGNGFNGSWVAIDPADGSSFTAEIVGDKTTQIVFTDDNATELCAGEPTTEYTSLSVGKVDGTSMMAVVKHAKCGTVPRPLSHGTEVSWVLEDGENDDPADDVLSSSFGDEFTRAD